MAAMEEARANSMRLYFGPGKKEPMDHEIFDFMKLKMRLNSNSLMSMYKEPREHCVYIKFKTEEMLKNSLLNLPSNMEFAYNKYESTTVTLSAASTVFKYVRIFNLPPEINDQEISTVMSKFGVIQRMVREKYAPETGFPIWSSVRGVHMEIKQEIPATVHVRNFQARVFYEGLQNKCFICGSKEHVKVNCPKRVNVNQRMEQNGDLSYSSVTARSDRWLGRVMANKKSDANGGGERQMVVLNNLYSVKPPKAPEVPIPDDPEVLPTADPVQLAGTSANEKESPAETVQEQTTKTIAPDEKIVSPVKGKEEGGNDGFKIVKYGKKNKGKRSVSSDSGKPGTNTEVTFIPPRDIALIQSMQTRGRQKLREANGNRSRSRSNLGQGNGSESENDLSLIEFGV